MAGVDVMAALDMFVERGEWEKCLQTAEQQVYIYLLGLYLFTEVYAIEFIQDLTVFRQLKQIACVM